MRINTLVGCAAALMLGVAGVAAQQPVAPVNLTNSEWTTPAAPFTIVGPIHYVGTKDLAAYLITTPAGHILIDGAVPSMAGEMEKSIAALGFKPQDIKILLTTQAHFDHVGTLAHFQKLSKASVRIMKGDDTLIADGGTSDYLLGSRAEAHFTPVKVDVVLKDGDVVTLGNVSLTALRTPGHTPGCSTSARPTPWFFRAAPP
jgi:metallo-beta-lactamase class B